MPNLSPTNMSPQSLSMKRFFPALVLFQALSVQADTAPSVGLVGNLYRGEELVSSFSMANLSAVGTPVELDDLVEHGYVDRAAYKNGKLEFLAASVASGLTLQISSQLTAPDTVLLRIKGEVAELNGFSLKATPGSTATVQTPRMHRNGFSSAAMVKKGESKDLVFGQCPPQGSGQNLCAYKLVITVSSTKP